MNRNQKIAVSIGVVLVIVSGLFPPYVGEMAIQGDNLKSPMGRYFLFDPPTPEDVNKAIRGKNASTPTGIYLARFRASIVLNEVLVQLLVIIIATAGVTLLLAKRKIQSQT